jgi:hypothetical protein
MIVWGGRNEHYSTKHRRQILRRCTESDTNANTFSDPNRDSYSDCNSNTYGYTYSNAEDRSHAKTSADACAAAIGRANWNYCRAFL